MLFDTSPAQLADIAGPILPPDYVRRLRRYRYGPGAFKLDWALDGPIPWRDLRCPQRLRVSVTIATASSRDSRASARLSAATARLMAATTAG